MPVFPGGTVTDPNPTPSVPATPVARKRVYWIDPGGAVTELSIEPGPTGIYMPPVRLDVEDLSGNAGSRLLLVRHQQRALVFPIFIEGATPINALNALRTMAYSLDPLRGDGRLRFVTESGSVREAACRYTGGLEGDETPGRAVPTLSRHVVSFLALDPYWYEQAPVQQVYKIDPGAQAFIPFLPIILGSSTVLNKQTITNTGDVDAWPIWTIRGPATSVTITNLSSGKAWSLPAGLGASEVLTIDTRPQLVSATDGTGANRMGDIPVSSSFWPLQQGANLVDLQVVGATTATQVVLTYQRRYLTP